jgi:CRP/FNR family cyclic AMP-dependent transcriptional regulator
MVNLIWENIFRSNRKGQDIPAILAESILFQDLTRRELRLIEEIVHVRNYHTSEEVFSQGQTGVGMFIIVRGSVDVSVTEQFDPDTQPESFVTRLIAGDFFGELSLIEDAGVRNATVRASEESTLIGFFKPDLMEVMERSPVTGAKIAYRLAQVLGRRLSETTGKIATLRKEIRSLRGRKPTKLEV